MFKRAYWFFAYFGLMTVWASFIMGFRYEPEAPAANIVFDILLYAVFVVVHIGMTMPVFKNAVYGQRAGTPMERRIYIAISVVSWVLVYWLHQPIGGFGWYARPGFTISAYAHICCASSDSLNSLHSTDSANWSACREPNYRIQSAQKPR